MSANYYYLVAQLPDISASAERAAPPITEKYWRDLCSRFLSPREKKTLDALSLVPPRLASDTGSRFLNEWYSRERALRNALAIARSQAMRKDAPAALASEIPGDIMQAARTAAAMDSPLGAERFLFEHRMAVLNALRPSDMFSIDSVYEYGLRLMLVSRMRLFNKESGSSAYREIYDSILGDTL